MSEMTKCGGGMQRDFHYKAFLSYSHKDQKVAEWLHKRLERYRLPSHLFSEVSNHVEESGALGRVFRDREELPVADDLTAEVRKALASSEFMIVLCSPNAAASRWVNKEVIEFKRLRGESFVLPIIIDGIPLASETDSASECFPPGLKFRLGPDGALSKVPAEPIAADIRKTADGKTRAVQKLTAGLLGLGLDKLVERELQRKQRRVMMITAFSVIAMLFMGALTYQAVMARQEAEFQRGQAEDLIEFMLTDLREKLVPVGRLDVLDAVGDKAVAYYGGEALHDMQDDSVGRRARAFHLLGEIEKDKNNAIKARELFQQARDATGDLLKRDPTNAQRIYEHAQSVFWIGYLDMEQGAYSAAEAAFKQYRDYGAQLVALDPSNPDWQMELAWGFNSVGALQENNLHQPEEALENFSRQSEILTELTQLDPASILYKRELAESFAWQADALVNFAHASEVLAIREKQRAMLSEVRELQPRNISILWPLMHSNRASAQVWLYMGEFDKALELYSEAERYAMALVSNDPENKSWALNLAQVRINLANSNLRAGNSAKAKQILQQYAEEIAAAVDDPSTATELILVQKLARDLLTLEIGLNTGLSDEDIALAEKLENELTNSWADVLSKESLETSMARLLLLKSGALKARGDNAAAELLLMKFWQGLLTPGQINKSLQQHPRILVPMAQVADAVGDREASEKFRGALRSRGYREPEKYLSRVS